MNIKLRPFQVPDFVIAETPARPRQEGFVGSPSWPLAEVDAETLAEMCDAFRYAVFCKAGKTDPGEGRLAH